MQNGMKKNGCTKEDTLKGVAFTVAAAAAGAGSFSLLTCLCPWLWGCGMPAASTFQTAAAGGATLGCTVGAGTAMYVGHVRLTARSANGAAQALLSGPEQEEMGPAPSR